MPPWKLVLRAAERLHAVWQARSGPTRSDDSQACGRLEETHRAWQHANDHCHKARLHGWSGIGPRLRAELLACVRAVQEAADVLRQHLERPVVPVPSLATLIEEIQQIDAEFHGLSIDWTRNALIATTEPITLHGVELGAFAMEFFWDRLADPADVQCFDIVALDPNPAAGNDRVTHPHVRNQKLCAGDATVPLRLALEQGRLADAFCLIRGVLTHYNPRSPHVPLDEWSGMECQDCGCVIGDDDRDYCAGCGQDYCTDCTGSCSACDNSRCMNCLERCAVCQAQCCRACLGSSARSGRECCPGCRQSCESCGAAVARDELAPQTNLCSHCLPPQPPPEGSSNAHQVSTAPILNNPPLENDHAPTVEPAAPGPA